MPVVVPELADHCVVVNGVAKTYAMTGWRVGWMIGPPDVVKAATNLQSHATSNVANVAQRAALAAVSRRPRRRWPRCGTPSTAAGDDATSCSTTSPASRCIEPEGAFYAFPSFKGVLGREIRGPHVRDHARAGRDPARRGQGGHRARRGVRRPGYARLSYALGDDDLVEGVTRIAKLLAE